MLISPMNLLQFFTPLQEAFDELADGLALLLRQILKSLLGYRSNLGPLASQSFPMPRSEMRTDNFIVLLFSVPV